MKGSEFIRTYKGRSLPIWENALFELSQENAREIPESPYVTLPLQEGEHQGVFRMRADVLKVGEQGDFVRMPLTPIGAQDILNLTGELLPTPLLVYRFWQRASFKLPPFSEAPNKGANLEQYEAHSRGIDQLAQAAGVTFGAALAGIKKHVVVSNIYQPKKVLIFGWYRPSPPFPDVLDDGRALGAPDRQPIQPKSNVHGEFYVDYSHGIQGVHPECTVDGQTRETEEVYRHPVLSRLVSNEGPVRLPRYPSKVPVGGRRANSFASVSTAAGGKGIILVPTRPALSEMGLEKILEARGIYTPRTRGGS